MKKILVSFLSSILIMVTLAGCSTGKYKDGSYPAMARGNLGDIKLSIEVKSGKIEDIKILEQKETPEIMEGAKNVLIPSIIKKQGTEGVDAVTGATKSSDAILKAVNEALHNAKK